MTDLEKIVLTSGSTVVAGAIVFTFGQLVQKFLIEPIHEQKKALGEINYNLYFYANIIANSGFDFKIAQMYGEERLSDADQRRIKTLEQVVKDLRHCAGQLAATTSGIFWYSFFAKLSFVPSLSNIEESIGSLTFISNNMFHPEGGRANSEESDKVKCLLGLSKLKLR